MISASEKLLVSFEILLGETPVVHGLGDMSEIDAELLRDRDDFLGRRIESTILRLDGNPSGPARREVGVLTDDGRVITCHFAG